MQCPDCKVEMELVDESWRWEMGAQVVEQQWRCPECSHLETELMLADASHELLLNLPRRRRRGRRRR